MIYIVTYLVGMVAIAVICCLLVLWAFNREVVETEPDFLADLAALEYVVNVDVKR